jgi:serpin B
MTSIKAAWPVLPVLCTMMLPAQEPALADARQLARSLNAFGQALGQRAGAADANRCLSPASVSLALLMVFAGAGGDTAAELRTALAPAGWDDARIHAAAAGLLAGLREPGEGIELLAADDLWPQQGHALRADYTATLARHYGAKVHALDFRGATEAARKAINDHVAAATRGRIRDLVPPDAIDADTRLVLTNALYFKASWAVPFDAGNTRNRAFVLGSGERVQVPTMSLRARLLHGETEAVQVLRLVYQGGAFAMDLALPREGQAFAAAEAALAAVGAGPGPGEISARDVLVLLPRFRIEGQFRLRGALQQAGLARMFAGDADFTRVDDGKGALRVAEVLHKTFLEVGEKGTEAAAATAVVKRLGSAVREPPVRFAADRPFAFRLLDLRTGLVLFAGGVADPRPTGS